MAEALVKNLFCRFGIPWELHRDQDRKFESRLLQEILQRLGVSKTPTTPLHPQSDCMVERYIKAVEEHLRKVVTSQHQKDWGGGEITPLSPNLQGLHSRQYRLDSKPPSVQVRNPTALRPVFGTPQKRNDPQQNMRQIKWTTCTISTIMPANT
jgi:hypothetical protein